MLLHCGTWITISTLTECGASRNLCDCHLFFVRLAKCHGSVPETDFAGVQHVFVSSIWMRANLHHEQRFEFFIP